MKLKEKTFELFFLLIAWFSILSVILICLFLFANGIPFISKVGIFNFVFGSTWSPSNDLYGIFPMIVGSLYITSGSLVVGVPIGILTAVFITSYCPKQLHVYLKPCINLMAGIPSIIYGFFGMTIVVPSIRILFGGNGNSILTASLLLGIMILPTIIMISESAIHAVDVSFYEGSLALGASHDRSIFKIVLPAAKSGILASIVLGTGRAIGETMAVIMIAGNQPRTTSNILDGIRTLTANVVIEMKYASGLHEDALIATGVVLFIFILIINIIFSYIKRKVGKYD